MKKAEKYYKNEGTNYKHRRPNKWRGNRHTTRKRIQSNASKDDEKSWKQNGRKCKNQLAIEELKNKHTETNTTFTESKNTLEGINSRLSEAEKWVSELDS